MGEESRNGRIDWGREGGERNGEKRMDGVVAIFICIYSSKLNHSTTNKVYHFKHNFKRNGKHFICTKTGAMLLSVPIQGYLNHQNGFESRLLYAQNTLTTIRHYSTSPFAVRKSSTCFQNTIKNWLRAPSWLELPQPHFQLGPLFFQTGARPKAANVLI